MNEGNVTQIHINMKPWLIEETPCICPYCGGVMQHRGFGQSVNVCPECGCSIEAMVQNLDTNPICPSCKQFLEDDNTCPRCGYALGTDFA